MRRILCLLILLFTAISTYSQEIAITFDDVPRSDSTLFSGEERTKKLISTLK
jgi:hypothetical protein